jgi:hypothetical protein
MMMDGKNFRTIECNCWSSEQRIKECNATDVDVQVNAKNTKDGREQAEMSSYFFLRLQCS